MDGIWTALEKGVAPPQKFDLEAAVPTTSHMVSYREKEASRWGGWGEGRKREEGGAARGQTLLT